jgi:DNA-binding LacI/PurR family transcriptional regulator
LNDISNKKPLYRIIVERLRGEIEKGILKPGDRIPTELELSQEFGVSRITARNAVKELANLGLVYRVQGRGTFVMEEAPTKAGAGREATDYTIISVVLPVSRDVHHATLTGIENECKNWAYHVTYHNSYFRAEHERELVDKIVSSGSKGLIAYPYAGIENLDLYSNLMVKGFPFIFIDRMVDCLPGTVIQCDNFQGAYDIVSYAIKLGHRRIAFIGDKLNQLESERERLRGYCRAHLDAGIEIREGYIFGMDVAEHDMYEARNPQVQNQGYRAVEAAIEQVLSLNPPPTCLVAVNDMTALYITGVLQKKGIHVPADVSLTGFDDLELVSHLPVPLTTVKQSFFEIGRLSAQLLLEKIKDPKAVLESRRLECELVIRESLAAPSGTSD